MFYGLLTPTVSLISATMDDFTSTPPSTYPPKLALVPHKMGLTSPSEMIQLAHHTKDILHLIFSEE